MKNKLFFDHHHAANYMVGSLIRFNGNPAYVEHIDIDPDDGQSLRALFRETHKSKLPRKNKPLRSKSFDMTAVPLGLTNWGRGNGFNHVLISARLPIRAWKVGLYTGNMSTILLMPGDPRTGGLGLSKSTILKSVPLAETILGKYPPFTRAFELVKEKDAYYSVAFSRNWAVGKDGRLLHRRHRNVVVGAVKDDGTASLYPAFEYLEQSLREEMRA